MPGSRCSTCAITYPPNHSKCKVCDGELWLAENMEADEDWPGVVEFAKLKTDPAKLKESRVTMYRVERFFSLGFDLDQAEVLARVRTRIGFFLYWGDVKKALDAGQSHAAAFDLFKPIEADTGEREAPREALPV